MSIVKKVEKLCKKFELSDNIKDLILKLCKDSYIKGSNDCFNILKDNYDTTRKSRTTNR